MSNNNSETLSQKEKLEEEIIKNVKTFVKDIYKKSMIFVMIFMFFVVNLFALSLSLHCNKDSTTMIRLSSALFAFMFGFFYILINF